MMPLTYKENRSYKKQKKNYIYKKYFSTDDNDHDYDDDKKYDNVRYHSYFTGKYMGAAHNICNLRHKIPK